MVYCDVNKKDETKVISETEERNITMNNEKNKFPGESAKRCFSTSPPLNLLEIVEDRELIRLAIEAATETAEKGLVRSVYNMPNWIPRNMILTVMTYAYATCLFSSVDLAEAVKKNPALRYLSSGVFPEHWTFIKFRRVNAHAIIHSVNCLINKIMKLCREQKMVNAHLTANYVENHLKCKVSETNTDEKCNLEPDGERRLALAVMRDCFEMDF